MTKAIRLGASVAALASVAMFAGLTAAQQAAAPAPAAAPPAAAIPMMAGPGGKMVPDMNGVWGGNLVTGGTSVVDTCNRAVDAFAQTNQRFTYQGRTGSPGPERSMALTIDPGMSICVTESPNS